MRDAAANRGIEIVEVSEHEFATAAETESPQGVLAIADIPARTWVGRLTPLGRVLVLDAVQDPGNVGTMLRTAAALGAAATVALPGTVDLWNAKVVRSAMGSHFSHTGNHGDLGRARRVAGGPQTWRCGAPMRAARPLPELSATARLRGSPIIVGNEGGGLTDQARRRAERLVGLPIGGVDSLNVAVAAGVLLCTSFGSDRPAGGGPAGGPGES